MRPSEQTSTDQSTSLLQRAKSLLTGGTKKSTRTPTQSDSLMYETLEGRQMMSGSQVMNFDELGVGDHIGAMHGVLDNGVGMTAWNGYVSNGIVNVKADGSIRAGDERNVGKQGLSIDFDEDRELIDRITLDVSNNFKGGLLLTDTEGDLQEIQLSGSKSVLQIVANINQRVGAISLRVDQGTASIRNIQFNESTLPDSATALARYDVVNPVQDVALLPLQTSQINQGATVAIGEGRAATILTGYQHGTVVKDGILYGISDQYGNAGTVANPHGKDSIKFTFTTRTAGITEIRIAADPGTVGHVTIRGHLPDQQIYFTGDTVIPWNPANGIDYIWLARTSGGKVGLKGLVMPLQRTGTQSEIVPYAHNDQWDDIVNAIVVDRRHQMIDIERDVQVANPLIASLRATGVPANITRANNLEKLIIGLQKQAHFADDEARVLEYVAVRAAARQATIASLIQTADQMKANEERGFTPLPPMDGLTELISLLKSGTLNTQNQARLEQALLSLAGPDADETVLLEVNQQLMQTVHAMNGQWSIEGSQNRQQDLAVRREAINQVTDAFAYLAEMMLARGRRDGILSTAVQRGKLDFVMAAKGMEDIVDRHNLEEHHAEYSIKDRTWQTLPTAENFVPGSASVSTNGKFILTGGADGRLVLHKSGTGEVLTTLKDFGQPIQSMKFITDDQALVQLADRALVVSLTGEEVANIPFNGRTLSTMHVIEETRNIAITFNFVAGQPNTSYIYSSEGKLLKEVNLGPNPVNNVTFGSTENSYSFSQNQYVHTKNLLTGQTSPGFNWWTLTGQNLETQAVVMDGNENGAFVFAAARNANNGVVSNSIVVALDKYGIKIGHFALGDGCIVDKMVDLGDGLLGITMRNQYNPNKQMVILKFSGNQFTELSRTTPTLSQTVDVVAAPDYSGVLNVKANGTELVALPADIQDGGLFHAIASGLRTITYAAIPRDVGGQNILLGMKEHLREMIHSFTGDRRYNMNDDFAWMKFLEANPHLTNDALAAQYGAGTQAYYNAIYVRGAEYYGLYKSRIETYNNQMSLMIEAAFDALVQEAQYEDPTARLNDLAAVEASQWIRVFEPIGIQHLDKLQVLDQIRAAIIDMANEFRRFQEYVNEKGAQQLRKMNNPNYAGSGAATPTPRQYLEEQRIAEQNYWLSQQPFYNSEGVQIGWGGKTYAEIQASQYGMIPNGNGAGIGGYLDPGVAASGTENALTFGSNISIDPYLERWIRELSWSNALLWYQEGLPMGGDLTITTETAAGRILAGAAQKLNGIGTVAANNAELHNILNVLSAVTGVSKSRFDDADSFLIGQSTAGGTVFSFNPTQFRNFFTLGQLGHVFTNQSSNEFGGISALSTNKSEYRSDETVTIKFDAPPTYTSIALYVLTSDPGAPPIFITSDQKTLFLRADVQGIMNKAGIDEAGHIAFRLVATLANGQQVSRDATGNIFTRSQHIYDLSLNENSDLNSKEDTILSIYKDNFPLEDASNWKNVFGSTFHAGKGFHAFDLNHNNTAFEDGAPIRIPADGVIDDIGFYPDEDLNDNLGPSSHIDVVHTSHVMIDGVLQEIKWFTQYLHVAMEKITVNGQEAYRCVYDGGVAILQKGQFLKKGEIFAGVSDVGAESNHFHGKISLYEFVNSKSVDPRLMFINMGVKSFVFLPDVPGESLATWDNDRDEWKVIASNNVGLFYRRDESTGNERYFATTAQKEEVRWNDDVNGWLMWNPASNFWYTTASGKKLQWNGSFFIEI